jgi:hypothetical protein
MAEVRRSALSSSVVAQQVAQEFARTFNIQWMTIPPDVMRQEHQDNHPHIDVPAANLTEGTLNA